MLVSYLRNPALWKLVVELVSDNWLFGSGEQQGCRSLLQILFIPTTKKGLRNDNSGHSFDRCLEKEFFKSVLTKTERELVRG